MLNLNSWCHLALPWKQPIISVVATVGSTGQACPLLTNFAQHTEQNKLCCPAQISHRLHFSNDGPISKHEKCCSTVRPWWTKQDLEPTTTPQTGLATTLPVIESAKVALCPSRGKDDR